MARSEQVDAHMVFASAALTLLIVPGLALFASGLAGRGQAKRPLLFALSGTAVVILLAVAGGSGALLGAVLAPQVTGAPAIEGVPGFGFAGGSGLYELARVWSLVAVCAVAVAVVAVAVASRMTVRAWWVFCVLWSVLVLFPVVYAFGALSGGWAVVRFEVIDYGGALPIGLATGASVAGIIIACGRREPIAQSGSSFSGVAIGGTIVWIGWLGLVIGSEEALNQYTVQIAVNAFLASSLGCLMWILVDRIRVRRTTLESVFHGLFAGVAAITPASGALTPGWSLVLGALAGLACTTVVDVTARVRFEPSFAFCTVATVGSIVGLLFVGLVGTGGGMAESGNFDLFIMQGVAAAVVLAYAFLVTLYLALLLRLTIGITWLRSGAETVRLSQLCVRTGRSWSSGTHIQPLSMCVHPPFIHPISSECSVVALVRAASTLRAVNIREKGDVARGRATIADESTTNSPCCARTVHDGDHDGRSRGAERSAGGECGVAVSQR